MPLRICKDKAVNIIDRTIPEVLLLRKRVSRLDIVEFCWMLRDMGADLLEIDCNVLKAVGKLPAGIDYIYRIYSDSDFDACMANNIQSCIIYKDMLLNRQLIQKLVDNGIDIIVDLNANNLFEIYNLRKLKNLSGMELIKGIRLTGLKSFNSLSWVKAVRKIEEILNVKIGICPQNTYYEANAVVTDALMNGINCVTASFMGIGKNNGFAALEEILVIIKVLLNSQLKTNLESLPEFSKRFSKITGLAIPDNKPVIGSKIFTYESGIHADGIEKNPMTYEPFDPGMVGQTRKMSIGKHSGKKSLVNKLKEIGCEYNTDDIPIILIKIREKSIELKRDLSDEEIRELCKVQLWI